MKILCHVHGKPAVVVGFAPGKKNKPLVMIICEGKMQAVRLKYIELKDLPEQLQPTGKVIQMPETRKDAS